MPCVVPCVVVCVVVCVVPCVVVCVVAIWWQTHEIWSNATRIQNHPAAAWNVTLFDTMPFQDNFTKFSYTLLNKKKTRKRLKKKLSKQTHTHTARKNGLYSWLVGRIVCNNLGLPSLFVGINLANSSFPSSLVQKRCTCTLILAPYNKNVCQECKVKWCMWGGPVIKPRYL